MRRPVVLARVRSWSIGCGFALLLAPALHADELGDVQRLYTAGDKTSAMARADGYLLDHPQDPQMRFVKGVMLVDDGKNAEAIALFRKLISDYPDLAEPYNNLAAVYAAEGDYDQARDTLQRALRANPSYATAQENLGDVYAALAAKAYSRALELDPKGGSAATKLALVRDLYKRSESEGAVSAASIAASAVPAASAAAPAAAAASSPVSGATKKPAEFHLPAPDPS